MKHRAIIGGARARLTTTNCATRPMSVQVNRSVREIPARVQAVPAGIDDVTSAPARRESPITQVWARWRPRPWPDPTSPALTASTQALITRRKRVLPARTTPLAAAAMMDAMHFDVHPFTGAETSENAAVYRAGPSGLRPARQRSMYTLGSSWSPSPDIPPVPPIVNSRPTPTLTETATLDRVCQHGPWFFFFTEAGAGRGQLLYPRHDGNLGLITPIGGATQDGAP